MKFGSAQPTIQLSDKLLFNQMARRVHQIREGAKWVLKALRLETTKGIVCRKKMRADGLHSIQMFGFVLSEGLTPAGA